jgi:hypothetical protein
MNNKETKDFIKKARKITKPFRCDAFIRIDVFKAKASIRAKLFG